MRVFDDVQRFRFLVNTEHSPLNFNDRLVYSYLVYRYCLVKHVRRAYPTTATRIGASTGLDRRTTVAGAIARLVEFGLAYKRGTGWFAREPAGQTTAWFKWRTDPEARRAEWYDRFAYQWHPIPGPACGLTPRQLYLFGLYASLVAQGKPLIADKYLVKLSGLDVSTVRTARQKLFALGLVADEPTGWQCRRVTPDGAWFLSATEPPADQPTTAAVPPAYHSPTPACLTPGAEPSMPDQRPPTGSVFGTADLDRLSDAELLTLYSQPPTRLELEYLAEMEAWENEWARAGSAQCEVIGVGSLSSVLPDGWSWADDEDAGNEHLYAAAGVDEIP